ncbi:hypothetical protein EJB05_08862, partial [Eragrostis curvula]
MSDELREFLAAEKKKIVTFKVRGEVFHGSKLILAMRSYVFGRMLYGSSGEKKPEDITIEVDTDPAAFKLLLHYIDTDSSPDTDDLDGDVSEETVKHLLVVADKYGMEYIKMGCERALSQRLEVKSVATTLALAHKHDCRLLKDACITFINSSDRHAVISSKGVGLWLACNEMDLIRSYTFCFQEQENYKENKEIVSQTKAFGVEEH